MPHGHGVDNCSLRLCMKGRQLDLGESRSPTQIFQRNQLPACHRFWAYVCTFGPGLLVMMAMVMMAMVMMAMVMVLVKVIIVPEALRQVGWLRQCQHRSFHRLRAFYQPKLPQTQSFPSAKSFPWKTLLLPKHGSLKHGSLKQAIKRAIQQAIKQALKQSLKQSPKRQRAANVRVCA